MNKNIYLDVDGVILASEHTLANYADEFLQKIITEYPDSTFWLTTHDWIEGNKVIERLSPYLKSETIELLLKVKSTKWDQWKTDGIDFSKPFLWFDDDCYPEEREVLIQNSALDNWVEVDLRRDPDQLSKFI